MADQGFVELRLIFSVVRRWWWLIVGMALIAANIAFIATKVIPPVYESSAVLLVNPARDSTTSQYSDLMAGTQLALTYSKMLTDRPVLETVISELGLKLSTDELADQITAEPVRNSQLIKLTVADTNPERAALIANALAQAFTKRVEDISTKQYAGEIKNAKDRMEALQAQEEDLRSKVDALRSQKVTKDVALANRQTSLTTLQSDYQMLQNSYQNLQLKAAETAGRAYIVEPVQAQNDLAQMLKSAVAVVSIGPEQPYGGSDLSGNRLAQTYGQWIKRPQLLQSVITDLGLVETVDQLSNKVSFEVIKGTQMIRFKVEDQDELRAQLILQSLLDAYIARVKALLSEPYSDQLANLKNSVEEKEGSINQTQIEIGALTSDIVKMAAELKRLETELDVVRNDYRAALQFYEQLQTTAVKESDAVIITEPAEPSELPRQNRILYIVVAAFLGLGLGTGLAFLFRYIDGKIRTDQDVRSMLNLPVLSAIGQIPVKDRDLVMDSETGSGIAEDFRLLCNKIRLIGVNTSVKTILVTSPIPSEGKSSVISNLAIGLSQMGLRIVLVDADLRNPRLHRIFGLSQDTGLADSLREGNVNGSLQTIGNGELKIISSGKIPPKPSELLSTPYLSKMLVELKKRADFVLIDCPPVLVASDSSILASKVDGVLLVLRAGSSEGKAAQDAIESLKQVKANIIGIVLNFVPDHKRKYNYYTYPQA